MKRQIIADNAVSHDDRPASQTMCIVAHRGGWAVKYGDSFLGVTARFDDALIVMASLADHALGLEARKGR
jgi:hypothetical protein